MGTRAVGTGIISKWYLCCHSHQAAAYKTQKLFVKCEMEWQSSSLTRPNVRDNRAAAPESRRRSRNKAANNLQEARPKSRGACKCAWHDGRRLAAQRQRL